MKKRSKEIVEILDENLGTDYRCYLHYNTPFQLLVATILSAQCTDARVNIVTKDLFEKYPGPEDFAKADLLEVEEAIHSVGFYHNKAKNIIACSRKIVTDFGGQVPRSLEELTSLPGVGRKTANVIRGNVFDDPSIVVDTHVGRISRRLGLTKETDPEKVEMDLMRQLPKDHWILYNMQIISFGRSICTARNPKCDRCFIRDYCIEYGKVAKS
jgi:endonuclease III